MIYFGSIQKVKGGIGGNTKTQPCEASKGAIEFRVTYIWGKITIY